MAAWNACTRETGTAPARERATGKTSAPVVRATGATSFGGASRLRHHPLGSSEEPTVAGAAVPQARAADCSRGHLSRRAISMEALSGYCFEGPEEALVCSMIARSAPSISRFLAGIGCWAAADAPGGAGCNRAPSGRACSLLRPPAPASARAAPALSPGGGTSQSDARCDGAPIEIASSAHLMKWLGGPTHIQ
eukprot:scaffold13386_cov214-Isochrysis_galbana.AAC.7